MNRCLTAPAATDRPAPAGLFRLAWILVAFAGASAVSAAPRQTYAELTLTDGRKFTSVEIVNYTANGVLARHANGATVFRLETLPESVIVALHLEGARTASLRQAYLDLADKPAVAEEGPKVAANEPAPTPAGLEQVPATLEGENADLANAPAVFLANAPAVLDGSGSLAEAVAVEPAAVLTPLAEDPNAGETAGASPAARRAIRQDYVDVAGRVVVRLASGEPRFLAGVQVSAYPAELLQQYLAAAKLKAREAAGRLMEQAAAAAAAGQMEESKSLADRAARTANRLLDYVPIAPVTARSDEFGNFTLRQNLPNLRIVAAAQVRDQQGEWSFEWVGISPQDDMLLTEANATNVIPAIRGGGKPANYALR